MTEVILFDLDGTLIDSAPGVAWSLNRALADEGHGALSVKQVKGLVGKGVVHLVADALAMTGGLENEAQRDHVTAAFLKIYSENPVQDTILFPHALETLDALRAGGVPMALCTNKPRITTDPVLEAFGLLPFFRVIVCGDEAMHKKPDGRHLHETLEKLNVADAHPVMVGDSENDILAAHDAGILSICVSFGYCHMPFEELAPTVLIDSFKDFPRAMGQIRDARMPN